MEKSIPAWQQSHSSLSLLILPSTHPDLSPISCNSRIRGGNPHLPERGDFTGSSGMEQQKKPWKKKSCVPEARPRAGLVRHPKAPAGLPERFGGFLWNSSLREEPQPCRVPGGCSAPSSHTTAAQKFCAIPKSPQMMGSGPDLQGFL